jgi:hypothetical protein
VSQPRQVRIGNSSYDAVIGKGSMKRFLIFLFLFPAIATASFYVVIYILSGAEIDSLSGPAWGYLIFIGPGLVFALVDWLLAKTPIPAVIGTTLFAYVVTVLLAQMDWGRGLDKGMLALGLVGAIPAAVCSWLSGRMHQGKQSMNERNTT